MYVPGLNSIKTTTGTTKRRGVSAADGFAELLSAAEAGDASATGVNDVTAASALNNLLALQEISQEDIQRKKLVQRGGTLLDSLEQLRRQLLQGTLGPHLLLDLGRQLTIEKQNVNDKALTELIEDIELRAAVELAKLQMALGTKDIQA